MALWLKQSTAVSVAIGPFVDAVDAVTAETGLTISQADVRLKKNDGNWAQKNDSNAAVHEEAGWYEVALNATDTNTLGRLILAVGESGALRVYHEFMVLPANVYDALVAGSDKLQTDVAQFGGADGTFAAGIPAVNTALIEGADATTTIEAAANAAVVDGLAVDTYAEPGQGAPPATTSLAVKIGYLFKAWRNPVSQTASQYALYNDDGTTLAQKATLSDDGTTTSRGKVTTGP